MYAAMTKDEGNEADGRFSAACQVSEEGFSIFSWRVSFAGAFSGFFLSLSFAAPTGDFDSSLARSLLFSLFRFLLLASSRSFSRLGMLSSLSFSVMSPESIYFSER